MTEPRAGVRHRALAVSTRLIACAAMLVAGIGNAQAADKAVSGQAKPQRIVSLNLCTDQLLMQMVPHKHIRAITLLARDARVSAMAREARSLPATSGVAEEVIALKPDIVLAGTFSTRQTITILRRLGYRVVEFAPETSIAAIRHNIEKMADVLGETARGEDMVAQIDRRIAEAPVFQGRRPVLADYDANGFTSGSDTLLGSIAHVAGFDMLGARLGFGGPRQVSLEQMLVARPDVIDPGEGYSGPALATQSLRHPALRRLMRERQVTNIPSAYTTCGNLRSLRALNILLQARRAV